MKSHVIPVKISATMMFLPWFAYAAKQSRVHLQCIVKTNTARCGVLNKNSSDWLFSFVLHSPLNFVCEVCHIAIRDKPSVVCIESETQRQFVQMMLYLHRG